MLEEIKEQVFRANLLLCQYGLVVLTWGNVSALSKDGNYVVIKPSGVPYDRMKPEDMVVVDLEGNLVEGRLRPSSDLPTHLELYKSFNGIGGIAHTHSRWATAFAQAERELPCYGTTHADTFYGPVPCTRAMTAEEIGSAYETNTGKVIVETFAEKSLNPLEIPGVLVHKHGPFTWGSSPDKAVENALILEETAHMAAITEQTSPGVSPAPQTLLDKHFLRKHGAGAYYGQGKA